jgi:hypothetical protein
MGEADGREGKGRTEQVETVFVTCVTTSHSVGILSRCTAILLSHACAVLTVKLSQVSHPGIQ